VVTTTVAPSSSNPNAMSASTRLRRRVIEILELLQVPTPRHLLQDVLGARGISVELGQLSRLGRADGTRAPRWPYAARFSASSGDLQPGSDRHPWHALTCSNWSLEQRIVGMYTPRARHPRVPAPAARG
jgi:hypothetical protein